MDQQIVQSAIEHYTDSDTEDLLALWLSNDRDLISQEGFEAIRRILSERLDSIPEQVDWEETNAPRSIDVSERQVDRPSPIPSWYRPATSETRLLQAASVACAVLGFVIFYFYFYLWQTTDLTRGLFNLKGLIASIGLLLSQYVLAGQARHLWVRSKQLRIPRIDEVAVNRDHPPIIYLRPFVADHSIGTAELRFSGVFGLGILQHARQPTFEEMMVVALDADGPVIAIGQPGEQYSPAGAIREYTDPHKWRERVTTLIEQAPIVVLVIGDSQGLLFELEEVYKRRGVRNLILVFDASALEEDASSVDLQITWSNFRWRFEEIAGIDLPRRIDFSRALLLCFLPDKDIRLIVGKRRTAGEWYAAFHVAKGLVVGKKPDPIRYKRKKRVVAWIVLAWYCIGFIGFLTAPWSVNVPPELENIRVRILWGISLAFITSLMNLTAAILLLMRRSSAVWLFAAALAISLLSGVMLGDFVRPLSDDKSGWNAIILFRGGISLAICIFSWRLLRRGELR